MVEPHEDSVDSWVERLRHNDILAVAYGFESGKIPGTGTYYDFLDRFWLMSKPGKVKKFKRKPKKNMKLRWRTAFTIYRYTLAWVRLPCTIAYWV